MVYIIVISINEVLHLMTLSKKFHFEANMQNQVIYSPVQKKGHESACVVTFFKKGETPRISVIYTRWVKIFQCKHDWAKIMFKIFKPVFLPIKGVRYENDREWR